MLSFKQSHWWYTTYFIRINYGWFSYVGIKKIVIKSVCNNLISKENIASGIV